MNLEPKYKIENKWKKAKKMVKKEVTVKCPYCGSENIQKQETDTILRIMPKNFCLYDVDGEKFHWCPC